MSKQQRLKHIEKFHNTKPTPTNQCQLPQEITSGATSSTIHNSPILSVPSSVATKYTSISHDDITGI